MTTYSNHWKKSGPRFPIIGKRDPLRIGGIAPGVPGFTIVELLVVIAVVGCLAVLLFPALGNARENSERAVCASNLRQLAAANMAYAADHGYFVAAAADIRGRNLQRWHGVRSNRSEAFDPRIGPLAAYLGEGQTIRQCPGFRPEYEGFEAGCGGYGYNACGVGSQAYMKGARHGATRGMAPGAIMSAAQTVMFTDAAFVQSDTLIEYSFAEPTRNLTDSAPPREAYPAMPSIHFRHDGYANVVWVDGHVTSEPIERLGAPAFAEHQLGWFGPADNSLFDPY